MPRRQKVKLEVQPALREHVNKRVVRIPKKFRDAIGINEGEKVLIKGPKTTLLRIAVKALREEVDDQIIGVDKADRERLGVEISDTVEIQKSSGQEQENLDPSRTIWLFCYGSNHPEQLGQRLGREIEGYAAYLPGYHRVFRGFSRMWQCGVASLKKVRDRNARTYGYVTQISAEELENLDRWEGVASGTGISSGAYKRSSFKVYSNIDGEEKYLNAVAYVSTSDIFNAPSEAYLSAVIKTISTFWKGADGGKVKLKDIPIRKNF